MHCANLRRIGTVPLLVAGLALGVQAQSPAPQPGTGSPKASAAKPAAASARSQGARAKPMAGPDIVNTNSEVFFNVVIDAGQTVSLDSTLDYTSAGTVAVAVDCPGCTTEATSLGSAGLKLNAAWLVPNANTYMFTENESGNALAYWDAGGAIFNVYGSQFRLNLQNSGSQGILLQQVTLFLRGQ